MLLCLIIFAVQALADPWAARRVQLEPDMSLPFRKGGDIAYNTPTKFFARMLPVPHQVKHPHPALPRLSGRGATISGPASDLRGNDASNRAFAEWVQLTWHIDKDVAQFGNDDA